MADISLLIAPTLTTIDSLTLDASISEQHSSEVEVTEHKIESGATITDHATPKALKLSIEGVVSNTPTNRSAVARIVETMGILVTSTSPFEAKQGAVGYAENAFAILENLRDHPKIITIVTKLKTYNNMILQKLNVPVNALNGEALRFTADFQQIRLVQNQIDTVTIAKTPAAKKKKSLGNQPNSDSGEPKAKSLLLQADEASGSLFQKGSTAIQGLLR